MSNFIPVSKPSISSKEVELVSKAVQSGWVSSLGEYIVEFEKIFADFCGVKYALTTSNGTTALHLALKSFGIGENDEVIIPDLTFIATANAVAYTGAQVVIADIDESTLCIDPSSVEKLIGPKTKAIIPVHLYGHPAKMNQLKDIAKKHNLFLIEDAAEAHGAKIGEKKVGSFGDASIFSFYGNKIVTTGEGGMLLTDSEDIYNRALLLRDHAMDKSKRYWHNEIGFNYRMTNLQAALGVAQMEKVDDIINKRQKIFQDYYKYLGNEANIRLNRTEGDCFNVYWMICLEVEYFSVETREEFMCKLKERGVDSRPYFYPISMMPSYENCRSECNVSTKIYERGVNLPTFHDITEDEIESVCRNVIEVLDEMEK